MMVVWLSSDADINARLSARSGKSGAQLVISIRKIGYGYVELVKTSCGKPCKANCHGDTAKFDGKRLRVRKRSRPGEEAP